MKLKKWGITFLGCVVIFAGLAFFKVMEIRAAIAFGASFPEHSESVEEAIVQSTEFTPTITVIGEMVAPQRLDLRNELAGEIALVNFESGAQVSKGQVLLELDTSVEKANLEAAKARADLARSVYKRSEELFRSKAVSKDQLDRAKADLSTTLAEMEALKRTIQKKTLKSPFDGRAGLHDFEVGQFLMDNTFITTLISDKDYIWVDFKVPQFYRQLSPGIQLEVTTIGQTNNQIRETATVVAENTIIEAANRSRLYRAKVPNDHNQFMANTMVNVKVPVGDSQWVVEIPSVAIQQDPLGQFVFLLVEDKENKGYRATRRQVQVRTIENNRAVISSGLKAGDLIAAAGAFKLHEGLLVFIRERQQLSEEVAAQTQTETETQDRL